MPCGIDFVECFFPAPLAPGRSCSPCAPVMFNCAALNSLKRMTNSGAGDLFHVHERCKRHLAAVGASHVELIDVVDLRARAAFGFHVCLPLAAETVEVIHQVAAHEGRHGGVDIVQIHLLRQRLFFIHIGHRAVEPRAGRTEWRRQSPYVWKERRDTP